MKHNYNQQKLKKKNDDIKNNINRKALHLLRMDIKELKKIKLKKYDMKQLIIISILRLKGTYF